VVAALERWVRSGLLTPEQADVLGQEHAGFSGEERRDWVQYMVSATAGVLTLLAAGVLTSWGWPHLGEVTRTGVIAVGGVGLLLGGLVLERRPGRVPVGTMMPTAGLGVLLMAYVYSERAWENGSLLSILIGIPVLSIPLLLAPLSVRRNAVMPAVVTTLGYAYLFVFLVRSGLDEEAALWVVDGVMVLSLLVLGAMAVARGADPPGEGSLEAGEPWEPAAFAATLLASPILIMLTALGPLNLGENAVLALDLWWMVLVGVTLWMMHLAPLSLRRGWIPRQLAWAVCCGIVLAFWTILGPLDGSPWMAAAAVGALGTASLWHGLAFQVRDTVISGCLALVIAAWYLGIEAGALGAAVALGFTAGLLFWVSGRLGDAAAGVEGVPS
jgi:hypothetical protein